MGSTQSLLGLAGRQAQALSPCPHPRLASYTHGPGHVHVRASPTLSNSKTEIDAAHWARG